MKKKTVVSAALAGVLTCGLLSYIFVDHFVEPHPTRAPSSIPNNYESLSACEKKDFLWAKVRTSVYQSLPEYRNLGLFQVLALSKQEISLKGRYRSDFAPEGWKKLLHGRGALASVKIVPTTNRYTGIFQGAECALLRLSLTYKTSGDNPVAPGLALKVLRDGTYSANISALVSLDGQGKDFNFFKFPMSNIVPIGDHFGQKWIHSIFSKVTSYPEELLAEDMAAFDSKGRSTPNVVAPRQLFFVPSKNLQFASKDHDVRLDFLKIPAGTEIYQIYAAPEKYRGFDYRTYTSKHASQFLSEAEHVADIISTSEFLASEFGDEGIFFKHQIRP